MRTRPGWFRVRRLPPDYTQAGQPSSPRGHGVCGSIAQCFLILLAYADRDHHQNACRSPGQEYDRQQSEPVDHVHRHLHKACRRCKYASSFDMRQSMSHVDVHTVLTSCTRCVQEVHAGLARPSPRRTMKPARCSAESTRTPPWLCHTVPRAPAPYEIRRETKVPRSGKWSRPSTHTVP
jgi:hypothetical protein